MVTLPRYSQPQVGASNQRQAQRSARASNDNPVGDALQETAQIGNAFAEKLYEGEVAAQMAKSDIQLRDEMDKAYRELETDTDADPTTFEARWDERSKEIITSKTGNIPGSKAQGVWQERANELALQRRFQVRDLTRKRQVEGVRAQALDVGAEYKRLAEDPATPDDTLAASRDMYLGLISVNRKNGIYDADTAKALELEAEETHRSSMSLRHLTNVDALMDAGRYGEAEAYFKSVDHEIDPSKRDGIEDAITLKSKAAVAIQTADTYWSETAGDFGAAMDKARSIKDMDERLAVEDRLQTMRAQDDRAQAEQRDAARSDAWTHLSEGGSSASMPSTVWKTLDGQERVQIQDWERSKREAAKRANDMSAAERRNAQLTSDVAKLALQADAATDPELYVMGPAAWEEQAPALYQDFMAMQPKEQMEIRLDIQKRKAKGSAVDTVDKAFKDVIELVEFNLPSSINPKKTDYTSETEKNPFNPHERAVRGALRSIVTEYVKRTGSEDIPPDDAKRMIARAYQSVDPEKFPMPGRNIMGTGFMGDMEIASKAEQIARNRVGREPTAAEIRAVYDQLK